jgi:prepilin-type N-terminal cleavage/methylation domain-containing protein
MSRLRSEEGFSLVELLVTILILGVVFGATLTAFDVFLRESNQATQQDEAQDAIRTASDRLTARLRNAVMGDTTNAGALEEATAYGLAFVRVQTSGTPPVGNPRNLVHVRYCLDTSNSSNGRLLRQTATWTAGAGMPAASGCPAAGSWSAPTVEATNIVNRVGGQNRPAFSYLPGSWSTLSDISSVRVDLFGDRNPGDARREVELVSAAGLRNVNRPPVASFSCLAEGVGHLVCDGGASYDPDGQTLSYSWLRCTPTPCTPTPVSGSSPRLDATLTPGNYSVALTVTNPGGLTSTSTQPFTVT